MSSRLSAVGVALRADHAPADAVDEAIDAASADVLMYLGRYPDHAALATNQWVTSVATNLAIVYLCGFRNNPVPKGCQSLWERHVEMLEAVQLGKMNLPGIALLRSRLPQAVHVTVNYGMYPSIRRTRQGSTDRPTGVSSKTDPSEPPDYT